MKKSFAYLFMFAAIQLGVVFVVAVLWLMAEGVSFREVLRQLKDMSDISNVSALMAGMLACYIVTLFVFVRFDWFNPRSGYIGTRPWGVMAWSAVASIGAIIPQLGVQELLPDLEDYNASLFANVMKDPMGILSVSIFAPLAEEVVFRGAILRTLLEKKRGIWMPIVISAVFFSVFHLNPAQMPWAFMCGILYGWVYARTRSIIPSFIMHCVNNSTATVLFLLMPQSDDMTLTELFGGLTNTLLAVVFSLMIFVPAIYQLYMSFRRSLR